MKPDALAQTQVRGGCRPPAAADAATRILAAQLAALRAIVHDLDYGIVVLDAQRRVQFVNRTFRKFWRVPDDVADSRPTFIKLMYHGRGNAAYAVAPHRLGDYLAKQLESIRTGHDGALNIRLNNGEVIRFRCKALPDGGRLLTYGNVSDLVREAEALERLAAIDGMTGLNNRRNFLCLAEAEWTRFRRYGRPMALLMLDIDHFKRGQRQLRPRRRRRSHQDGRRHFAEAEARVRYRRTAGRRGIRAGLAGGNA